MLGSPLLENKKCLGFLILKFPGFLVLKFLGFSVSKVYHISISCLQEDVDPISEMVKNILDGSSGIVCARLFQHFKNVGFPNS